MAENEFTPERETGEMFKEAVCIDAMRIYDSCSASQYSSYILYSNKPHFA